MDKVVEIMRIKRHPPMGKLVIEIGNQKFDRFSQLPSDVIKQMVLAAIGDLIVFADGYQTLVDAGVAPPIVSSSADDSSNIDASISEREAVFKAAIEEDRLAELAGDGSHLGAEPTVAAEPKRGDTGPLEEQLDIAGQVNIFLQKQVQLTPQLQGRSIYIAGDETGSLTIFADGRGYSRPADIDDPLVRKAIQDALKEWDTGRLAAY